METKDLTQEQLEHLLQETQESNFRLTNIILENTKTIEFLQEYQQEAKALRSVVYCLENRIEGYNKLLGDIYDNVGDIKILISFESLNFLESESKLRHDPNPTHKEMLADPDLEELIEPPTSSETNTFLLIEAVKEFVNRVEKGEVRSKYTYSKFKAILKRFENEN